MIMNIIDQGEYAQARELIADNDLLTTFVVQENSYAGRNQKKRLYNIARAYIEACDWKPSKKYNGRGFIIEEADLYQERLVQFWFNFFPFSRF